MQLPQSSVFPQPSGIDPQVAPCWAHVVGVHWTALAGQEPPSWSCTRTPVVALYLQNKSFLFSPGNCGYEQKIGSVEVSLCPSLKAKSSVAGH